MLINLYLTYKSKKKSSKYIIFPIPQQTSTQKILYQRIFPKTSCKLLKDTRYNNQFYLTKDIKTIKYFALVKLTKKANEELLKNPKLFLEKDRFVIPDHPEIKEIAAKLKAKTQISTVKRAFEYTVEKLKYKNPIKGLYSLNDALKVLNGKKDGVDCGGFSVFLISLLRNLKIPSRLAVGFLLTKNFISQILNFSFLTFNFLYMHAWVEVFTKERGWLSLDPSIEWRRRKGLTKRNTTFDKFFDDRILFSYGEDFSIKLNNKKFEIDILQNVIEI